MKRVILAALVLAAVVSFAMQLNPGDRSSRTLDAQEQLQKSVEIRRLMCANGPDRLVDCQFGDD
jgi:hypothetical protein